MFQELAAKRIRSPPLFHRNVKTTFRYMDYVASTIRRVKRKGACTNLPIVIIHIDATAVDTIGIEGSSALIRVHGEYQTPRAKCEHQRHYCPKVDELMERLKEKDETN